MKRLTTILAALLMTAPIFAGFGGPQIKELIKIFGVGAAVREFGPEINREFNKLTGHKDTNASFTKVVPIISVGIGGRGAIGAAQVMGSRQNVEKVKAVASPDIELFGEIRLRALIPVDSINIGDISNIKPVDGVGVSGIVDLDL